MSFAIRTTPPVAGEQPGGEGVVGLPARGQVRRILCLKPDHIGDMLIGAPALLLLRRSFADAHITLVCAPWNVGLARRLGVADAIHTSSFFSQTSLADLDHEAFARRRAAAMAELQALDLGTFDLAIDLRRDDDTRELLKLFRARAYAGMGDLATFSYLDVALPFARAPADGGPAGLVLHPADLDAGMGHRLSEAGLHLTAGQAELAFMIETDAVWPPADEGMDDLRLLGVALSRVDVRGLPGEGGAEGEGAGPAATREIARRAMQFGSGWLGWEPWGRWSSIARADVTATCPVADGRDVELLVQLQGHTAPSHPVANVALVTAQGRSAHVFRVGDAPATLAVPVRPRVSPPTARSAPFLLRAGRYAGMLRVLVPAVKDYAPLVLRVRGAQIGVTIAQLATPLAIDAAGELHFPFEVELRDTAEPMQIEIAFAGERRSERLAVVSVSLDCLQARSPRLPVMHVETQLTDLVAMAALRFAPALVAPAGGEVAEALRRPREGSTAGEAVARLHAARSRRRWFAREAGGRRLIGIGIGANKATKLWPERHFEALCRRLLARPDVVLVFIGGPAEAEAVKALAGRLRQRGRVIDLVGCCRIEDLGEVLAALDGFIGLDTGTTHFAGRVGLPTLALFGASHDPREWGPVGDRGAWAVVDVPCGSCSKAELRQCGMALQCMTMLTPEGVWPMVERMLLQ